jgi:hypothetical protein
MNFFSSIRNTISSTFNKVYQNVVNYIYPKKPDLIKPAIPVLETVIIPELEPELEPEYVYILGNIEYLVLSTYEVRLAEKTTGRPLSIEEFLEIYMAKYGDYVRKYITFQESMSADFLEAVIPYLRGERRKKFRHDLWYILLNDPELIKSVQDKRVLFNTTNIQTHWITNKFPEYRNIPFISKIDSFGLKRLKGANYADMVNEYCEAFQEVTGYKIITAVEFSIHDTDINRAANMMNYERLYGNSKLIYSNNPIKNDKFKSTLNVNTGQCVLTYLNHLYNNDSSRYKWWFHYQINKHGYINCVPIISYFKSIYEDTDIWDEKGVSINMLYTWCVLNNISCYLLDSSKEIIKKSISDITHEKVICAYIFNNHLYPITDTKIIHSIANHKTPILLSLIAPSFKMMNNTDKNIFPIVSELSFDELWEFINSTVDNKLYITHAYEGFNEFSDFCKIKHRTIIDVNISKNLIQFRNCNASLLTINEGEYLSTIRWCNNNGVMFEPKCNINLITTNSLFEFGGLINKVSECTDFVLTDELATKILSTLSNNTITSDELILMYRKNPFCTASGNYLYISDNPQHNLSIDRKNSQLCYSVQNCRLMSAYDVHAKSDLTLAQYRYKHDYYIDISSDYSDESMNVLCGNMDKAIKSKNISRSFNRCDKLGLVNFDDTTLLAFDIAKAHSTALYQGLPNYSAFNNHKVDGFIEFDNKVFDWPIFSAYDEIIPIMNNTAIRNVPGVYYVVFNKKIQHNDYEFFMNDWYCQAAIYYFKRINCDFTILYVRYASKTISYDYFRNTIDDILAYDNNKSAINTLIGSFGKSAVDKKLSYDYMDHNEALVKYLNNGILSKNKINSLKYDETNLLSEQYYNVIINDKQWLQTNMLPIYNIVIQMTVIRAYQLYQNMTMYLYKPITDAEEYKIINIECKLIQIKTDSVLMQYNNIKDKNNVCHYLSSNKYYRQEKSGIIMPASNVFCNISKIYEPEYKAINYNLMRDNNDKLRNYLIDNLSTLEQKDIFLLNQIKNSSITFDKSFAIHAAAGCGKSHLISKIFKYYKNCNKNVKLCAYTNEVSAMYKKYDICAQTIHNCLNIDISVKNSDNKVIINNSCYKVDMTIDVLIIDEISMVPSNLLSLILRLKRTIGFIVICVGDWTQLDSINDSINIVTRENSQVYKNLIDYQVLNLNINLRSDNTIFDIRNTIVFNKSTYLDISDFINNHTYSDEIIYKGLCVTHNMRIKKNHEMLKTWMLHKYPTLTDKRTLKFIFKEYDSSKKDNLVNTEVLLTIGIPLICEMRYIKLKIIKGDKVTICDWDTDSIHILDSYGNILIIPFNIVSTHFALAFVTTVHRSQGSTIDENYILYDYMLYDWRMLNVAVTRATSHKYLFFDKAKLIVPINPIIRTLASIEHETVVQQEELIKKTYKIKYSYFDEYLKKHNHEHKKCFTIHKNNGVIDLYASLGPNAFVIRDDDTMAYYLFKSIDIFSKLWSEYVLDCDYKNIKTNMHEIVNPNNMQRVYFDIDMPINELLTDLTKLGYNATYDDAVEYGETILDTIKEIVNAYCDIQTPTARYSKEIIREYDLINDYTSIYDSCDDTKLSYHFMSAIYTRNSTTSKHIFLELRTKIINNMSINSKYPLLNLNKIIDVNMSRPWSSLRLEGSYKGTRCKVLHVENYDHQFQDGYIQIQHIPPILIRDIEREIVHVVADNVDSDVQINITNKMLIRDAEFTNNFKFRSNSLWLDRLKPSLCELCDRIHDNDNCIYFTVKNNITYMSCTKSKRKICIG